MAETIPARGNSTKVATVERMDNGALLKVRSRSANGDTLILQKVYLDPALLVSDLLIALDFSKS